MSILVTIFTPPVFEQRWRWSWLWFRWEVQTLSEDYVFVYDGGCLEDLEPWEPM